MQSRRLIAATVAATIAASVHAQEQGGESDPIAFQSDNVVVTGTRVRDRVRLDTLIPVDALTAELLADQSTNELAEALATVTPALTFPRPAITDGTDHIRPASLRGLAPDQMLVLVNSKRRHQSALLNVNSSVGRGSSAVDLNAIPLAAVERVEVLRDGASAQYGSDAIAGVLNVRLREARTGGAARVQYGQYETDVQAGRASYSQSDGATATASAWAGLPLGADGFLTISGEYRDRDFTSRGDSDGRLNPPVINSRLGEPELEDATLYVNAGSPVGDLWSTYGWLGYQVRDSASAAVPRIANNVNNDPATFPNGFLPIITTDIDDLTAAWGFRGPLAGWETDVSLVYGRNELDYGVEGTLNGTLVVPGQPTQTSFDAGGLEYDQLAFNYGMVRGFDVGLAGPLNFAVGLEARRETYGINAGEPNSFITGPRTGPGLSSGSQGFPGFQPIDAANTDDADRNAVGLYVDLESRMTEKLLGSAAVRAEDYSDFGSNVSGKLAARFDFTQAFALRSAVSTGFRAPSLQQQFFSSNATTFNTQGVAFNVATLPVNLAQNMGLGAVALDAEESVSYSVGALFRTGTLEATVDAYRIDIDDRIVLTENLGGPAQPAIAQLLNGGAARFFTNGVDTETQGVDLVVRYGMVFSSVGSLNLTLSGNVNDTDVTRVPVNVAIPNLILFNQNNVTIFEEGTPESKISMAADWGRPMPFGRLGAGLKVTRYGSATDPGGLPDASQAYELQDRTLVDLELRANVGRSFSAAIGADNLFDQYPSVAPAAINLLGVLSFSRFSPFGYGGRFVYGRLAWNW